MCFGWYARVLSLRRLGVHLGMFGGVYCLSEIYDEVVYFRCYLYCVYCYVHGW